MRWRTNLTVLPSLWSDHMDMEIIEVFQTVPLEVLTKKLFVLTSVLPHTGKKTDVNRRLLIDFFLISYRQLIGRFQNRINIVFLSN